ncbi:MAG: High-affinity branched-chain amino acid transport system permease protein LivH [Firmicutes bacterium]|nr:High-affinity branched-chain amino acid transport system permease protein LivH [Bacillota bacterium]MDI6705377.1 branched-chain amino acid ABC transporter permease [Bacillota bacterium]
MIIGQIIANGILMGFIYALVAVGLTLTWGVMDIINFAHGEFLMIGMYTAFWMFMLFALDPLVSLPICIAVLFILGVLTYTGIISRVINAPGLTALLATFGFSMFLKNFAQYLWTPNYRYINAAVVSGKTIQLGSIVIGLPQIVAAAASIILTIVVMAFMDKTRTGKAIQATALDKNTALLMGINTKRMYAITFGFSGACVGAAGALMATFFPIYPASGALYSVIAFVIVALGGFGNIKGALFGGLIIGLTEALGGYFLGTQFKYALVFLVYLIVIQVRPKGLFGW